MKSIWDNAPSWANHLVCSELGTFWHWVSEYRTTGDVAPVRSLLAAKSEKGACSTGSVVHMGNGAGWILVASRPVAATAEEEGLNQHAEITRLARRYLALRDAGVIVQLQSSEWLFAGALDKAADRLLEGCDEATAPSMAVPPYAVRVTVETQEHRQDYLITAEELAASSADLCAAAASLGWARIKALGDGGFRTASKHSGV